MPDNILAHSDVAPFRKIDPGSTFPWLKLHKKKIVFMPNYIRKKNILEIYNWFNKNKIKSRKTIAIIVLSFIGYNVSNTQNKNSLYKKLIYNYQSHFMQKNLTGKADTKTLNYIISHYLTLLLTQSKI